jgi:hypothetical protein
MLRHVASITNRNAKGKFDKMIFSNLAISKHQKVYKAPLIINLGA